MAAKRYYDTELSNKAKEVHDVHAHLEQRERESSEMNKNLLSHPKKGHDMVELNPMVGGY